MIRAASVEVLTNAVASARCKAGYTERAVSRAMRAIAAAERLATAARHAANAIAAEHNRREGGAAPGVDMVDIRTELLIALEIFEQLPNGNVKR